MIQFLFDVHNLFNILKKYFLNCLHLSAVLSEFIKIDGMGRYPKLRAGLRVVARVKI